MNDPIDAAIAVIACVTAFTALIVLPAIAYEVWQQHKARKWINRLRRIEAGRYRQRSMASAK